MILSVLTWNIRHGLGIDGRLDLDRVLAVIRQADPDIVFLNEVDRRMRRSGRIDQAAWLAARLGMRCYFAKSFGFRLAGFGNALLVKGTIAHAESVWLSREWEPRKALVARVEVAGTTLTCVGVHLSPRPSRRIAELAQLERLVEATSGRRIVAGDFNLELSRGDAAPRFGGLTDVFAQEPAPTFPSHDPIARLDYLFMPSDCNIIDKKVIGTVASDHLPLVTVIDM